MFLISGSDGDVIYQAFKNEDGNVPVAKFIAVSFTEKNKVVITAGLDLQYVTVFNLIVICNQFSVFRLWKKLALESKIQGCKKQWQTLHSICNKKILKDLLMRKHSEGSKLKNLYFSISFYLLMKSTGLM